MKRLLFVVLVVVPAVPSVSHAQVKPDEAPAISEPQPGIWQRGTPRWFAANTTDLGFLYLRPRLTLGYGKPFWRFVGVDLNPLATNTGVAAYGGLRFVIPHVDLRVGARYWYAFQHQFLVQKDSYQVLDLNEISGDKSRYLTLESELSSAIPAGPGSVLLLGSITSIESVPKDRYVYEETIRVISYRWLWRARAGYAIRLGREGNATAGVVTEVIGLPGRDKYVFRAGIIGTFGITEHLEALLAIVPPLISPDSIGIAGGDIGEIGVRYRWATGTLSGL